MQYLLLEFQDMITKEFIDFLASAKDGIESTKVNYSFFEIDEKEINKWTFKTLSRDRFVLTMVKLGELKNADD